VVSIYQQNYEFSVAITMTKHCT